MNTLSVFYFDKNDIEVVIIDGEPWFNASQVAKALGYVNAPQALQDNVFAKYIQQIYLGRPGKKPSFISEPGLYQLVMRSDLPSAGRFQDWVFEEVLPTIRKTGSYSTESTQPLAPYWYQRLLLDGTKNRVPRGYFSIFRECVDLIRDLESNGYILDDSLVPDISVGQMWSKHLKNNLGIDPDSIRERYTHYYPDGRCPDASCYLNEYLPEFRRWFNEFYLNEHLTKYLGQRDGNSLPAIEKLLELPSGSLSNILKGS